MRAPVTRSVKSWALAVTPLSFPIDFLNCISSLQWLWPTETSVTSCVNYLHSSRIHFFPAGPRYREGTSNLPPTTLQGCSFDDIRWKKKAAELSKSCWWECNCVMSAVVQGLKRKGTWHFNMSLAERNQVWWAAHTRSTQSNVPSGAAVRWDDTLMLFLTQSNAEGLEY